MCEVHGYSHTVSHGDCVALRSGLFAYINWEVFGSSLSNMPVNLTTTSGLTLLKLVSPARVAEHAVPGGCTRALID